MTTAALDGATAEGRRKSLKDGGKPVRSGRWQIMINGEGYKTIVAEAAKKALGMENIFERVFIVKLHPRRQRPEPDRRRRRLLGAREQDLRVQGQGHADRRRRRGQRVPSALDGRGHGPRLVSGMERRLDLRHGGRSRRRADHDGEPVRADPLQGRLRPGRRLVPAVQVEGDQRASARTTSSRTRPMLAAVSRPTTRRSSCRPACATTPC